MFIFAFRQELNSLPPRLSAISECGSENEDGLNGVEHLLESNSESSTLSGLLETNGYFNSCHSFNGNCFCEVNSSALHENGCKDENDMHCANCELLMGYSERARETEYTGISVMIPPVETNPLTWTPNQLHQWLRNTVISVGIADQLREEVRFVLFF